MGRSSLTSGVLAKSPNGTLACGNGAGMTGSGGGVGGVAQPAPINRAAPRKAQKIFIMNNGMIKLAWLKSNYCQ